MGTDCKFIRDSGKNSVTNTGLCGIIKLNKYLMRGTQGDDNDVKKMTKLLCALLCGVLVCGAVAAAVPKDDQGTTPAPRQVPVDIVTGDSRTSVSMKQNEQIQLVVKEENQSEQPMTGSGSGNPSDSESEWEIKKGSDIIELDGTTGVVSAKKAGTAEVAKRVKGGVAACVIEVSGYAVEQITVEGAQEMRIGETQNLKLSITPTEAQDDANVTWTSDRPEILSVVKQAR